MARTFGGTTTDKLSVTNYTAINSLAQISISVFVHRTGAGGNSLGRIIDKEHTLGTGWVVYVFSDQYVFQSRRSGNFGSWHCDAPLNTFHHFGLTYNSASTSNNPIFYIDGSAVTTVLEQAPTGTLLSDTNVLTIGNRDTNNRHLDGTLSEASVFNTIKSAREMAALAKGITADQFAGCVCYLPMYGRMSPEPNLRHRNGGVLVNTVQAAHPKVFQRRGRSFVPVTLNMYDLALDAGSYSLTGSMMSPEFGGVVGVESGVYTITGTPSSTRHAAVVGAEPGSYSITGTEPVLLRDHIYQPASGVYTISGTAAAFDITEPGAHELTLDSGVYAIDGGEVGFIKDANLPVDSGVYTIAGQPATLLDSGSDDDEQHLLMLLGMGG